MLLRSGFLCVNRREIGMESFRPVVQPFSFQVLFFSVGISCLSQMFLRLRTLCFLAPYLLYTVLRMLCYKYISHASSRESESSHFSAKSYREEYAPFHATLRPEAGWRARSRSGWLLRGRSSKVRTFVVFAGIRLQLGVTYGAHTRTLSVVLSCLQVRLHTRGTGRALRSEFSS